MENTSHMNELRQLVERYYSNKAIVKERNDENKSLLLDIDVALDKLDQDVVPVKLQSGETVFLQRKFSIKDKTDKGAIATEIGVDKKELKTVYHFSKLTKQGKLEPEVIAKHTYPEEKSKIKFTKKQPKNTKNNNEE